MLPPTILCAVKPVAHMCTCMPPASAACVRRLQLRLQLLDNNQYISIRCSRRLGLQIADLAARSSQAAKCHAAHADQMHHAADVHRQALPFSSSSQMMQPLHEGMQLNTPHTTSAMVDSSMQKKSPPAPGQQDLRQQRSAKVCDADHFAGVQILAVQAASDQLSPLPPARLI